MKRCRQLLFAVFAGLVAMTAQAAVVFNDGDFTNWTFGSVTAGTGTATAVVEATGGNPGARVNVTTVTATLTDSAFGTAVKNDFSTSSALEGTPFVLALDVLSGPGSFNQGQGIQLLVEQAGSVYGLGVGVTFVQATFTRLTFNGTLNAASFTRVSGAGPATPNLAGGVTTRFGFAAGNSASSTLTQFYDNVSLDIVVSAPPPPPSTPAAPIPTLSQWALILLAGVLGLMAMRRMRPRG